MIRELRPAGLVLLLLTGCVCTAVSPAPPVRAAGPAPAEAKPPTAAPSEPAAAAGPAPAVAPAVASKSTLDAGERIAASPDAITIDASGAAGGEAFDLRGTLGEVRDVRLRLAMSVEMEVGERRVPATDVPAMDIAMTTKVTAVDDRTTTVAIDVTGVEVGDAGNATPRVRDALKRTAERLRSATGSLIVSHDGQTLTFDYPRSADGAAAGILEPELGGLAAAWQELVPAIPAASPLGAGARWQSVRHVQRDSAVLEQRARWTLSTVAEERTLVLEAEHVATDAAASGAGAAVVKAQRGTTRGEIVMGRGPVPVRATATVTTTTRAALGPIGAEGEAAVRTTMTLDLQPAK